VSKLLVHGSNRRIYNVDQHVGVVSSVAVVHAGLGPQSCTMPHRDCNTYGIGATREVGMALGCGLCIELIFQAKLFQVGSVNMKQTWMVACFRSLGYRQSACT
jgi:hypothetical protein